MRKPQAMRSVLLDTDDLYVAEEVVSAFFGRIRMDARQRGAPTPARLLRSFVGSTSVDTAEFGFAFGYTMAPPDKILLARIHSGAMELATKHGPPEVFGPGRVGAVGGFGGEPLRGTCHQGRWDTYLIDSAYLGQVAAARDGYEVRLTGSVPVSHAANRQLATAMDYVRDAVAANPDAARNPMVAGAAQRHLAASILAAYPNTALSDPAIHDGRYTMPALLRRAIAFIDDNAQRDVSLRDIADAVHLSPRAVQYMFRRHRGCTPMQYLRQMRLHHAHLDLVAADPSVSTVRTIALRWGFAHMGRFAASYRSVYGRSPHATLSALIAAVQEAVQGRLDQFVDDRVPRGRLGPEEGGA
jgi:AraC-like DNA-binding protein